MPARLSTRDIDFQSRFETFLTRKREISDDVGAIVADIIGAVRARGDEALIAYTERFDGLTLTSETMRVTDSEIDRAVAACDAQAFDALTFAHGRITSHHARQRPQDDSYTDELGVELGTRWTAVEAAGLYVPGGLASYPSSVLMNAVPARVAGVPRIVMVVPTPRGEINPLVLAAARIAGVHEVYRVGGAQAIAALAYGTQTIAPVAKIVGPGNAYVAAAKRAVFGTVGIDSIAGPSEVLVIADADNNPAWIAADLLAQAEHDTAAQSILMTDDAGFADAVVAEVARQLASLARGNIAGESWNTFGAVIVLEDLCEAPQLADRIAAEHLQIATRNAADLAASIRNAGAIFLGALTPEVIGDYVSGSNHVLPTARSARFSSGLGVLDFMKRTSILQLDGASLAALASPAMTLARAEGLEGHRRSVEIRLGTERSTEAGCSATFKG
ncbi:MAG: histidinol dehydrogenase [Hyphomicrobiaceae bacterium]